MKIQITRFQLYYSSLPPATPKCQNFLDDWELGVGDGEGYVLQGRAHRLRQDSEVLIGGHSSAVEARVVDSEANKRGLHTKQRAPADCIKIDHSRGSGQSLQFNMIGNDFTPRSRKKIQRWVRWPARAGSQLSIARCVNSLWMNGVK